MNFLKHTTADHLVFSFLAGMLVSATLFMILPLSFQGPEIFKSCSNIHISSCSFVKTVQWHWFGMYHVLFSPEGLHYPAVMNYKLAHGWEAAVAAVIAVIAGLVTYSLLLDLIHTTRRRTDDSE